MNRKQKTNSQAHGKREATAVATRSGQLSTSLITTCKKRWISGRIASLIGRYFVMETYSKVSQSMPDLFSSRWSPRFLIISTKLQLSVSSQPSSLCVIPMVCMKNCRKGFKVSYGACNTCIKPTHVNKIWTTWSSENGIVTSYCKIVQYLIETHVTETFVTETHTDVMLFMQRSTKSRTEYAEASQIWRYDVIDYMKIPYTWHF